MAVEDGVALSRALLKMTSLDKLSDCLEIFQKVRCSRANKMQEASLLNGRLWHFPDGPLQQARDAAMEREVRGLHFVHSPNQWSDPTTQMWCYGYDTEGEIDKAWDKKARDEIKSNGIQLRSFDKKRSPGIEALEDKTIPLIINGVDVVLESGERQFPIPNASATGYTCFQGATRQLAAQAAESSAQAFISWSKTKPAERRALLQTLAQVFKTNIKEIEQICQEETHSDPVFAQMITQDALELIEECAALTTSAVLGSIPSVRGDAYGLVFKEPLGVILGIAPWNAPIMLGLRAVIAPIAAGNTAILKVILSTRFFFVAYEV